MKNLLLELKTTLEADDRLIVNGELVKNKIVEMALALNPDLISLLLTNDTVSKTFFIKIKDILVFDKIAFQKFVSNKEFLQNNYTAFKYNIGLTTTNDEFLTDSKEVVLVWPYKDCVLEGGQTKEDQKRKEIFWNETLASDEIDRLLDAKVLTNFKKYDKTGEHAITDINIEDNLIIKGNNLLALHSLERQYAGKVKMIYIDPPYNTDTDSFLYNDSFNHSTWLTFMKNRLEVAKELLTDDGVIFVQCCDKEQAYIKVLLDNMFKIENFEVTIYVQVRFKNKTLNADNDFQKLIEHIHVYKKPGYKTNRDIVSYSLDDWKWKITEKTKGKIVEIDGRDVIIFEKGEYEINEIEASSNGLKETWGSGSLINQGGSAAEFFDLNLKQRKEIDGLEILYKVIGMGTNGDGLGYRYITGPKKANTIRCKFYTGLPLDKRKQLESGKLTKSVPINNLLLDSELYDNNFIDMKEAFGNCTTQGDVKFNSGKKPEQLLKRLIEISTNEGDLILDYHLGSGTTCAVAHKMNRRYIGIEQMDYIKDLPVQRLNNVIAGDSSGISKDLNWKGGGSFIYCELLQNNANIIDKIEQAKTTRALKSIWKELEYSEFISYKIKPELINDNIKIFEELSFNEQQQFLVEILDKNQLYVNYSEIDDKNYKVSKAEKRLNKKFYSEV